MTNSRVLKRGPGREVRLETGGEEPVVVKRFDHGPLWRLGRGRRRAQREFAALRWAENAGLAVPTPLSLSRTPGGWEITMSWIPGARTLAEHLVQGLAPEPGWKPFLTRLGALFADLAQADLEHPDLHTENVLVDGGGSPWLIDFHQARTARSTSITQLEDELVSWTAFTREYLDVRSRRRFLDAWLAHLPAEKRPGLAAQPRELEALARIKRRQLVSHGLGRWLRPSGKVRLEEGRLIRRSTLVLPEAWEEIVFAGDQQRLWHTAARLEEHNILAPRPKLLDQAPGRAHFLSPALESPPRIHLASLMDGVREQLRDRGLTAKALGESHLRTGPDGKAWLLPTIELSPP